MTIKSLRSSISIIPQSPTIFKVNLRNNLDPLNLYSDEELKSVMEQIKLQDLSLEDMPELSTGQK